MYIHYVLIRKYSKQAAKQQGNKNRVKGLQTYSTTAKNKSHLWYVMFHAKITALSII